MAPLFTQQNGLTRIPIILGSMKSGTYLLSVVHFVTSGPSPFILPFLLAANKLAAPVLCFKTAPIISKERSDVVDKRLHRGANLTVLPDYVASL